MSEARLWEKLRDNLNLGFGNMDRVENMLMAGMPDVNFCINGVEGWIELKYTHSAPARETTKVFGREGLRDAQINWIQERVRIGGNVYLMSQVGKVIQLHTGSLAPHFNGLTYRELTELAIWSYPAQPWSELKIYLTGRKPIRRR